MDPQSGTATLSVGTNFALNLWFVLGAGSEFSSNNSVNVSHGTYVVGCSDGDYTSWDTIVVAEICTPVTSSQNINLCAGDTFSIGTHNYTTGGTYIDTIPAVNSCDSIVTTNITLISYPVLTVTNDTAICAGSSVVLTAGGTGNSFSWSTGETTASITVNTADTFFVWSGNYCGMNIDSVIVTVNPLPTVNFAVDTITIGSIQPVPLTPNATDPNTYLWSTGETTPSIIADTVGWFYVTVTNDCGSATDSVFIRLSTGSKVLQSKVLQSVHICPNPATDFIQILGYTDGFEQVTIYNQIGQCVMVVVDKSEMMSINVSMLKPGVYIIKTDTHNGTVYSDAKPIRFLKE